LAFRTKHNLLGISGLKLKRAKKLVKSLPFLIGSDSTLRAGINEGKEIF
jgi:hypothetical protein